MKNGVVVRGIIPSFQEGTASPQGRSESCVCEERQARWGTGAEWEMVE